MANGLIIRTVREMLFPKGLLKQHIQIWKRICRKRVFDGYLFRSYSFGQGS